MSNSEDVEVPGSEELLTSLFTTSSSGSTTTVPIIEIFQRDDVRRTPRNRTNHEVCNPITQQHEQRFSVLAPNQDSWKTSTVVRRSLQPSIRALVRVCCFMNCLTVFEINDQRGDQQ